MFINHTQDQERQGKTNNCHSVEEINAPDSMWYHGIGPRKRKKIVEKLGKSKYSLIIVAIDDFLILIIIRWPHKKLS